MSKIPNTLSIISYMHCGECLKEIPKDISPQNWSQIEIGFTKKGIQIWCKRHNINIAHIDFQGQTHPANVSFKIKKTKAKKK